MPRIKFDDATDSTLLKDLHGIGSSTFIALGSAGYPITPRTTLGGFRDMTGSYDELVTRLNERGVGTAFVLTKIRSLWSGIVPGGTRKRKEPSSASSTQNEASRAVATTGNFLLDPDKIEGVDPKTGQDKEEKDVPEVDALSRMPDPTKAVGTGMVAPQPLMSVIPDVTLNISPDDKNVAAPMEVLPEAPVPVIPGSAIGAHVREVRMTTPQSLEAKQAQQMNKPPQPSTKANGEKDIGGDGDGALTEEAKVGKDEPVNGATMKGQAAGMKWRSVPYGSKPSGGITAASDTPAPEKDVEMEKEPNEMATATRHPFKQPALFRNHDAKMKFSKELQEAARVAQKHMMAGKEAAVVQMSDQSFFKYNAPTQAVNAPFMPPSSSNYNSREAFTTQYQIFGAAPLINQWPPSAYTWETITGRYR